MKKLFYVFVPALLLASCQESVIDQEAEAEKLMQLSREWSASVQAGDLEKVMSYWAEDAIIMSPDDPSMKGKESIRGMVERSLQNPGFEIRWEPREAYVSESGDLGYVLIQNYYTIPVDTLGNRKKVFNKGVEIWKKQEDGSWKNAVDIYNGDPSIESLD